MIDEQKEKQQIQNGIECLQFLASNLALKATKEEIFNTINQNNSILLRALGVFYADIIKDHNFDTKTQVSLLSKIIAPTRAEIKKMDDFVVSNFSATISKIEKIKMLKNVLVKNFSEESFANRTLTNLLGRIKEFEWKFNIKTLPEIITTLKNSLGDYNFSEEEIVGLSEKCGSFFLYSSKAKLDGVENALNRLKQLIIKTSIDDEFTSDEKKGEIIDKINGYNIKKLLKRCASIGTCEPSMLTASLNFLSGMSVEQLGYNHCFFMRDEEADRLIYNYSDFALKPSLSALEYIATKNATCLSVPLIDYLKTMNEINIKLHNCNSKYNLTNKIITEDNFMDVANLSMNKLEKRINPALEILSKLMSGDEIVEYLKHDLSIFSIDTNLVMAKFFMVFENSDGSKDDLKEKFNAVLAKGFYDDLSQVRSKKSGTTLPNENYDEAFEAFKKKPFECKINFKEDEILDFFAQASTDSAKYIKKYNEKKLAKSQKVVSEPVKEEIVLPTPLTLESAIMDFEAIKKHIIDVQEFSNNISCEDFNDLIALSKNYNYLNDFVKDVKGEIETVVNNYKDVKYSDKLLSEFDGYKKAVEQTKIEYKNLVGAYKNAFKLIDEQIKIVDQKDEEIAKSYDQIPNYISDDKFEHKEENKQELNLWLEKTEKIKGFFAEEFKEIDQQKEYYDKYEQLIMYKEDLADVLGQIKEFFKGFKKLDNTLDNYIGVKPSESYAKDGLIIKSYTEVFQFLNRFINQDNTDAIKILKECIEKREKSELSEITAILRGVIQPRFEDNGEIANKNNTSDKTFKVLFEAQELTKKLETSIKNICENADLIDDEYVTATSLSVHNQNKKQIDEKVEQYNAKLKGILETAERIKADIKTLDSVISQTEYMIRFSEIENKQMKSEEERNSLKEIKEKSMLDKIKVLF